MTDLSNYRKSYEKSELAEDHLPEDPINLFKKWFIEMEEFDGPGEVNAMTVSTLGLDGFPKSRIVLLKQYTYEGFIFFTNYGSEKGKAIASNPNVCLSFFWEGMERQVIIKGKAEKVSQNTSDGYFETRPEGSRLGAIVSPQSQVIPSRNYLEDNLKQLKQEFEGKEIPRPKHWGGYIVKPVEVEFWQGRPNRLHDRIRYMQLDDFSWKTDRLAP
ncbi:pyridoxamine 5'-phosphate oxidase [Flavobacterium sp. DG1-102-2]|uniref:pyridoxamine 5'-phosphate oxidase n=1 Tax=Flavobacterium sp. DG1-102-2 TaxID=3081663 RepID=UPI00294A3FF9|nr:pyridoxamine 5'-phosphate oxidase [Flavobacterium sp. DG1-102-2]MDV6167299.1 pyridoxamine 5'-phosphate oxidase [Flavobacterium sp. DG1-102-2]